MKMVCGLHICETNAKTMSHNTVLQHFQQDLRDLVNTVVD